MPRRVEDPITRRVQAASQRRRETQKAALRVVIFQAAARMVAEHGYDAFSLRKLAEEVGYTATTIYRYFGSKDALVREVIREGYRRLGEASIAAYASTSDPANRLDALGLAYFRFGLENRDFYRLMFLRRPEFLPIHGEGEGDTPDSFGCLVRAVTEALPRSRTPDRSPLGMSLALWALVHGAVSLAITLPHFDEPTTDALIRDTMALSAGWLPNG